MDLEKYKPKSEPTAIAWTASGVSFSSAFQTLPDHQKRDVGDVLPSSLGCRSIVQSSTFTFFDGGLTAAAPPAVAPDDLRFDVPAAPAPASPASPAAPAPAAPPPPAPAPGHRRVRPSIVWVLGRAVHARASVVPDAFEVERGVARPEQPRAREGVPERHDVVGLMICRSPR